MAREVVTVISVWCDVCLRRANERTPATFDSVIEINGQRRQLMLCEAHEKEIIGQLPELLLEYGDRSIHVANAPKIGRPPKSSHRDTNEELWPCPVPGCDHNASKRSNLSAHVRRMHNTSLSALGVTSRREETPRPCPINGCEYVGKSGGGLASHLRSHSPEEQKAAGQILGSGWGGTQ